MPKQTGLGRGLSALIPTPTNTSLAEGLHHLPVTSIQPNPYQPRRTFDEQAISSLAASIAEVGVLQPVIVRPTQSGPYELVAGERRWRAAQRVGLSHIPALIQAHPDLQMLQLAVIENLHREDLNPLEIAAAYHQLITDFSLTHDELAKRIGKSRAAVTNTLRLLQLPAKIQRLLLDERLTMGHARALLALPDRQSQEDLADEIVSKNLSVRKVEEMVRRNSTTDQPHTLPNTATPDPQPRPSIVIELEDLLSASLKTKVNISLTKTRSGRLTIEFDSIENLHRLATLLLEPQLQV
jgi:ParB family chromosome partitioning protein